MVRALTVVFWSTAAVTVGWIAVFAWDYDLVGASFGEKGSRLTTTVLMGVLVLTSGFLMLHYRRTAIDDAYWSMAELVYVSALFLSLFYGIYSFLGWLFYA